MEGGKGGGGGEMRFGAALDIFLSALVCVCVLRAGRTRRDRRQWESWAERKKDIAVVKVTGGEGEGGEEME